MQKECVLCDIATNIAYSHLYNLSERSSSKGYQKTNYRWTVHFTIALEGLYSMAWIELCKTEVRSATKAARSGSVYRPHIRALPVILLTVF
jgi:hypothetical protein